MITTRLFRSDPIIVFGMHRSGTQLLVNILRSLGVFTGAMLEENGESTCYIDLNDWLLDLAHARWDYPLAFRRLRDDNRLLTRIVLELRKRVQSYQFAKTYLGLRRVPAYLTRPSYLWGWKDPRNTITLPVWSRIYPEAKYIFIARDGIAAALSLSRRQREALANPLMTLFADELARFYSVRCQYVAEALALWEEYHQMLFECENELKELPYLELRFEALVGEPTETLMRIIEFIGVDPDIDRIGQIVREIESQRPSSPPSKEVSPELKNAYENSRITKRLGYAF
jgi:hypothetical protein